MGLDKINEMHNATLRAADEGFFVVSYCADGNV